MATILNAGTTATTGLNLTTDTSGALAIQTSGVNAISISTGQVVTLAHPLLPASGGTGISSLGAGVATFLGTPSSANLAAALTDETGSGSAVFSVSPTFTGTPLAPTPAPGTNTTQIATTAFVLANGVPSGAIMMWSGSIVSIPSGWFLCDGANSTPDLRNRFIVGAGSTYAVAATGGSADAIVVSHTHTASSTSSVSDPGHTHYSYGSGAFNGGGDGGAYGQAGTGYGARALQGAYTGISVGTSTSITSAGTSGTNANLPPYYALAFIMKA